MFSSYRRSKAADQAGSATSVSAKFATKSSSKANGEEGNAKKSSAADVTEVTEVTAPAHAEIFISYQWDKQRQVKALYDKLTGLGYSCWMDLKQMGGGDGLYDKIEEGITGCRVFLSCVTEEYAASENCRREVSVADGRKKMIIPLKMDKSSWPPPGPMAMVFGPKLFVNFCKPNEEIQEHWNCPQFQELIDRLDRALTQINAKTTRKENDVATSATVELSSKNAWDRQQLKFATRLRMESKVQGVAIIDRKICVVCDEIISDQSNKSGVKIFSDSPPHEKFGEILIDAVKEQVQTPQDLVACSDSGLLFVATNVFHKFENNCNSSSNRPFYGYVWSVRPNTVDDEREVKKVVHLVEEGINGLSITSGRLLVTPVSDRDELRVYDASDGQLLKTVELIVSPIWAMETSEGTYLVGFPLQTFDHLASQKPQTTETNTASQWVCSTSSEMPLCEVGDDGCPIEHEVNGSDVEQIVRLVEDVSSTCKLAIEYDNQRVVLINSQLQSETVLLTRLQKVVKPRRMCFAPVVGLFAVAGDNYVSVYTVNQVEPEKEISVLSRNARAKLLECYKQTPKFTGRIALPSKYSKVYGVSVIGGKICVISNDDVHDDDSNCGIKMFEDSPPYRSLGEIRLQTVKEQVQTPQDLVACSDSGLLFVATNVFRKFENNCNSSSNRPFYGYVWSVRPNTVDDEREVKKVVYLHEEGINGLSITSGRLLVAPLSDRDELRVYDASDGQLLKTVELIVYPFYAIETANGKYVVCSNDSEMQVSSVDTNGRFLVYRRTREILKISEVGDDGCPVKINKAEEDKLQQQIVRVVMDTTNNCLLAIDLHEQQVILVNSQLQFERPLLTKIQKVVSPRRICFVPDKKLLAVAGENVVNLYTLI